VVTEGLKYILQKNIVVNEGSRYYFYRKIVFWYVNDYYIIYISILLWYVNNINRLDTRMILICKIIFFCKIIS